MIICILTLIILAFVCQHLYAPVEVSHKEFLWARQVAKMEMYEEEVARDMAAYEASEKLQRYEDARQARRKAQGYK